MVDKLGDTKDEDQLKADCYDYVQGQAFGRKFDNVYHSILFEDSLQSIGIQLADYAAGIMFGYLKRKLIEPNNYPVAEDFFHKYIEPHLRCKCDGTIMGYGIKETPRHYCSRIQTAKLFSKPHPLIAV